MSESITKFIPSDYTYTPSPKMLEEMSTLAVAGCRCEVQVSNTVAFADAGETLILCAVRFVMPI